MSLSERNADAVHRLENELAVLIRRVRRAIAERAQMVHPDLNVTGYSMLTSLQETGPQRAARLAELFSLDKGAVSRQVSALEELGFVERSRDPEDGRAHLLEITPAALERLAEVTRLRRNRLDERLSAWSEADVLSLVDQLTRYNATLERD